MENTIDTLQIKISKAREELSQESRQAIDAVNWKLIILSMSDKFSPEQLDTLETETELLLCGITNTNDFQKELETRMKIPKNEVGNLLGEMDKLIFKKMQIELENRIGAKEEKTGTVYTNKPFAPDPRFTNVSRSTQEAISYSSWKENVYRIGQKYNLAVDKMGALEEATAKVFLGSIKPSQYEDEVKNKINLPEDKLKELISEINEVVFKNIKDTMVSGVINNEEPARPHESSGAGGLIINNKRGDTEVPLPPYVTSSKQEVVSSKDKITNNRGTDQNTQQEDVYREHGIDIISDNYLHENEGVVFPSISPKNTPVRQNSPNIIDSNIIANKLSGNTVSHNTVTDYSLHKINPQIQNLPKMQGGSLSKPHDPYHEEI